jgi:hypothetical protein
VLVCAARRDDERKTNLLLQIDPLQCKCVADNGERHEVVIAYQLRRRECGQCINEQLASALELSHRDKVQAAVDFEAITAVPVAAFVYESAKGRCSIMKRGQEGRARGKYALFGFGKMGSDEFMIPKEKADPDESKHDIDSRAQSRCLLQSQ